MFPQPKKMNLPNGNFPTKWQTVIFRNYGFVPTGNIAKILGTDESTVVLEANRLGLSDTGIAEKFLQEAYITVIRNNWLLLPYDQLMQLLDFTEKRLDFVLQEEDFLSVKLGGKADCERITYFPLSESQKQETEEIAQTVKRRYQKEYSYFGFFKSEKDFSGTFDLAGKRIVHGYTVSCGDPFMEDSKEYLSDVQLRAYRQQGVNGIFIHAVLSALSPYPFKPSLSEGYEIRRQNLKELIKRAAEYGIKIYLYLNEPRALRSEETEAFPHLKGHTSNGYTSFCFMQKETQEYLYEAVLDLVSDCGNLGGIISITMSENFTHCHSKRGNNCPHCATLPPEESAAAVNNVLMKALRDSGTGAELLAMLWCWSERVGWSKEQVKKGIRLLDKEIIVMAVSESDLSFEKGGVKNRVVDYSISNVGPSEASAEWLLYAKSIGRKTAAKIQASNSWECSCVPYLPVFDLVAKHVENLKKLGVNDYMMSWTLGGYPSPALDMVAHLSAGNSLEEWYRTYYGKHADEVRRAVASFCKGFKEYPFDISGLYYSPKNLGCANLWTLKQTDQRSTMVSISLDNYEAWIGPYGYEIYISQMQKLLTEWERSVSLFDSIDSPSEKEQELALYAKTAYAHFVSDVNHTKYAYLKREKEKNRKELLLVIDREKENTLRLLDCAKRDSKIGYEASNHYFYTQNGLLEKLVNLEKLTKELEG